MGLWMHYPPSRLQATCDDECITTLMQGREILIKCWSQRLVLRDGVQLARVGIVFRV